MSDGPTEQEIRDAQQRAEQIREQYKTTGALPSRGTPAPAASCPNDSADARAYAVLSFRGRARLAAAEPKRYEALRGARDRRVTALRQALVSAKTFTERQRVRRELDALTDCAGGDDQGPSAA